MYATLLHQRGNVPFRVTGETNKRSYPGPSAFHGGLQAGALQEPPWQVMRQHGKGLTPFQVAVLVRAT